MTLKFTRIEKLPDMPGKGPRDSQCRDLIREARDIYPAWVSVTSDDPGEVERLYRTAMQWRIRHKHEFTILIRKAKPFFYVQVVPREVDESLTNLHRSRAA